MKSNEPWDSMKLAIKYTGQVLLALVLAWMLIAGTILLFGGK